MIALGACGGGDDAGGGSVDAANAGEGAAPASDGGSADAVAEASLPEALADDRLDGAADAADAALPVEDAGPPCSPSTFATDCPIVACQTIAGCVANRCQYTPIAVCVARSISGSFGSGVVDQTVGTVTLHGNISVFRPLDGPLCAGGVCVTGGISP
jgi:hypothetical protein